eukprot:1437682-Alexandrium_andersonii.AAC.1
MSASLVGSEMCIRDSPSLRPVPPVKWERSIHRALTPSMQFRQEPWHPPKQDGSEQEQEEEADEHQYGHY